MIRDFYFSKLLKYSFFFRAYADYHHARRGTPGKNEEDLKGQDNEALRTGSLKELVRKAEKTGAAVYGKELILGYSEDPEKTILLVSHDLSRSGAPLALLNLALTLKRAGWQTLIVSPLDGAVGTYAADHGIPSIYDKSLYNAGCISAIKDLFALIIVNTIVCAPVVNELDGTDAAVIWWIHEANVLYDLEKANTVSRKLTDNICVCCTGNYARCALTRRFPRYNAETLLYYVKDNSCYNTDAAASLRAPAAEQKVFACIGSFENRKGQDILIEAIENLPDKIRRNCRFIFAGIAADPAIIKQIQEMQQRSPGQIVFLGELRKEELYEVYKEIDFLICPSRDDPMPIVAAEAMSLGKPCLCSRNTGTSDIIRRYKAGYIYKKNDPRRLAKLIIQAYNMQDDEYRRLAENARYAFEDVFSEDVFEKRLAEIMMRLTGKYIIHTDYDE